MILFDKLKNKRSSLQEVKDDTTGRSKKPIKVNLKNLVDKAKKNPLNKNLGVKITDTDNNTIKQSEISKQAKQFTKKIEKNQTVKAIQKDADRLVRKAEKGDKKARKKIFKVLDKKFKKLSPADQEAQAKKMYDVQKKMGRTFNPKTGNFEGPDTKFQKSISKIKDSKGKRITSGPVSVTAGPEIRKRVEKIRDTRATKAGMPDPFKSTTKFSQKQFNKTLKSRGVKVPQVPLIPDPFGKGDTKGQMNVKGLEAKAFKKTQPKDVKLPKSFTDFSKKLKTLKTDVAKTASATPRTVTKKYKPTTTVKQSEVSKQAKDFTKKVNQARTKKVTPTTTASKPKTTNVFKRVTAATSGKKVTNSKGIGNKFRGKENKAAKDAMIKSQRDAAGMGGGKPPKPPRNVTFSAADFPDDNSRKIVKKVTGKRTVNPSGGTRTPRVVTKQTKALMSKQQTFVKSAIGKSLQKNLPQVYKVAKNPVVRQVAKKAIKAAPVAAIPIGLAASPYARTAIKTALLGGGLSAFKSKKVPVAKLNKEKKIGKTVKFSLSPNQKA